MSRRQKALSFVPKIGLGVLAMLILLFVAQTPAQAEPDEKSVPDEIEAEYYMPIPPVVTCLGIEKPLSGPGQAVDNVLLTMDPPPHFSTRTRCNRFNGDWILDVPNVTSATPNMTAEQFYSKTGALIANTQYVFSMSTLGFSTHDELGTHNLVRTYLAPYVAILHNKTPVDGPYPLLRFAYADRDGSIQHHHDDVEEVFADLTAFLPEDQSTWRVSIAVGQVGDIDIFQGWNHSKVAVSDYRHAIVGGMNWDLSYIVGIDSGESGLHRVHDLSVQVEGEAAQAAAVFFDKLWKRTVPPATPNLGDDCETSWEIPFPWSNDCLLKLVPPYTPLPHNKIPDYYLPKIHHVFGLGRGHIEYELNSPKDLSADRAIIAALKSSNDEILISQHQLTLGNGSIFIFTPEVKEAIVNAIVDPERQAVVRIVLSEPWGEGPTPLDLVFAQLDAAILEEAEEVYNTPEEVTDALCRLEFGVFRVAPNVPGLPYYTHNKFFMTDGVAFYVGSQNLYPSAVGPTISPEHNEYGFFVDDAVLAAQMRQEYWEPIWTQTKAWPGLFQSPNVSGGCDNRWATYLYDNAHTGVNTAESTLAPPLNTETELVPPPGYGLAYSAPVANGDTLFVIYQGINDSIISAYDIQDHSLVWSATFSGVAGSDVHPVIANGTYYVTTKNNLGNDILYALDAETGAILWQKQVTGHFEKAILYEPGTIYVSETSGSTVTLHALDAQNSTSLWNYTMNSSTSIGSPVIVNDTLAFYTGGRVVALDKFSGQWLWEIPINNSSYLWDLVGSSEQDFIYLYSDYGITAITAGTGYVYWSTVTGSSDAVPVLWKDTLYHLGTVNGTEYLFKIDAASGVLEGQLPITADGYSFHFMTMANGVIYTTNGNTFNPLLTAFDAQTGNLLWSSTESGASDLPAIIAGGKVYVVRLNASEVVVYGP